MRYSIALLLAAVSFTACEQGQDPLSPRTARQAAAVTSHGSFKEPITVVLTNPCLPEEVVLSGSLHTTFSLVLDAAGGAHFQTTTNPQGLSGVGQTTGAKYQASGSEHVTSNLLASGTISETYTNSFLITAQGTVPNFKVHVTQHLTINANGEVATVVDNVTTSCN